MRDKNSENSLTITDNRTGKQYAIEILEGDVVRAMDLRQIKVRKGDFGMMAYDPGFMNTAATKSRITFVDGGKGNLEYRGYPIQQLAERSTFLETAYLILKGELPTASELEGFVDAVAKQAFVPENLADLIQSFRYDAHAMSIMASGVAALSTFHPGASQVDDAEARWTQIVSLIGKMPTLAAFAYRHSQGLPRVYPRADFSYAENFLSMLFQAGDREYRPDPVLARALDQLFILHADHEQNCSTTAMRVIGSSKPDPFSATAGAIAALYGPLHGGANEAVLRMLQEIGRVENIPDFMESVKRGERRLMGFGHRVYKAYDPRAALIKRTADEVFEITGRSPLLDIALELERIALGEDYFVKRNLYPNVDFYSGLIYQAMGFPKELFPVLFAIARTVGWLAQWEELVQDPEQRIARPRQVYLGSARRDFPGVA